MTCYVLWTTHVCGSTFSHTGPPGQLESFRPAARLMSNALHLPGPLFISCLNLLYYLDISQTILYSDFVIPCLCFHNTQNNMVHFTHSTTCSNLYGIYVTTSPYDQLWNIWNIKRKTFTFLDNFGEYFHWLHESFSHRNLSYTLLYNFGLLKSYVRQYFVQRNVV